MSILLFFYSSFLSIFTSIFIPISISTSVSTSVSVSVSLSISVSVSVSVSISVSIYQSKTGGQFRLGKSFQSINLDDSSDSGSAMMKKTASTTTNSDRKGNLVDKNSIGNSKSKSEVGGGTASTASTFEIEEGMKEDLKGLNLAHVNVNNVNIENMDHQNLDHDHTGYDHHSDAERKSTILQASLNYINSIVGAGIIGLPYAVQRCGVFAGMFMFCARCFKRSFLFYLFSLRLFILPPLSMKPIFGIY